VLVLFPCGNEQPVSLIEHNLPPIEVDLQFPFEDISDVASLAPIKLDELAGEFHQAQLLTIEPMNLYANAWSGRVPGRGLEVQSIGRHCEKPIIIAYIAAQNDGDATDWKGPGLPCPKRAQQAALLRFARRPVAALQMRGSVTELMKRGVQAYPLPSATCFLITFLSSLPTLVLGI
jgi:hypothetical protein